MITSRSDVLAESRPKSLAQKWFVNLEEENYGPDERILLYERRLPGLPASLQAIVVNYRAEAIRALSTPMEMQRYFDTLREGMQENENANEYVQRCLREADQGTIEAALLNAVELRNEWPYAAALWGLFKSRAKLSFGLVPIIQAGLTERDPRLEDGLERYINFLIAGRNIRQNDSVLSYHHPRVELGLEQAIMKRPGQSGRILEYLIQILIDQDRLTPGDDWGREGAAHIVAAAGALEKFDLRLKQATRNTVDDWLRSRLLNGGARFEENLRVAANAASPESAPGELARWLTDVPSRRDWSFGVWSPEERPREWYAWLRADTAAKPICEIFIRDVLRRSHHFYGRNFAVQIAKVADGLTSVFLEVAATMVRDGVNSNDYAIANGAVADLDGFDRIAVAAIAYQAELENHPDDETWLSLINGEYDAEAAEYYWESRGEDGYTADVFINTYVTALRRERGWRAISGHSQMTGLLYAWMHTIDEEKNASDDELRDLATAALNGPYEDRFWHLLCDQSYCDTGTQLHRRLLTGSADSGARFSAMELAVARYPSLLAQVAATLYDAGNLLRLFQMAVDLRAIARANGRHSERAAEGLTAIVSVLSAPPAAVARALFDPKQTIPLDQPALALLRSVDLTADAQLAMACAEAAGEAGSFNIGYLREILADSQNDDAQLDLSVRAIKLAISAQNWSIVEESLQHRFADVREHALVALAEQTTDVLPARLLALANDKGHGVRQALLKILAQRRRTEHIDTLIILAGDDWADRGSYYGQDPDHPIAVAAAELLAEPPKLNKTQVDSIARRVSTSEDSNASRRLLVALICNGEPDTPDRVMTLALKTGRPPLHQYAAEALLLTREFLDTSVANRITADQLIRRPASIACALASTLGAAAEISHLVEVSKAVASVPQRRALAFVIWLEARERDSVAENTIRNLLPPEFATAMAAAANGGRRLRRESLDQLADIRVAEAIRTMWPNLFKERPK